MKKNLFLDFLYWLLIDGPKDLEIIPLFLGWIIPGLEVIWWIVPTTIQPTPGSFFLIPVSWIVAFALYCLKRYGENNEKK